MPPIVNNYYQSEAPQKKKPVRIQSELLRRVRHQTNDIWYLNWFVRQKKILPENIPFAFVSFNNATAWVDTIEIKT